MRLKLLALTLIAALLTSPLTYTAFAEETSPDPTIQGDEPVEGFGDLNETEGLDDTDGTAMDPAVLEGLRNQTQNMYEGLLGYFGNATLGSIVLENFRHAKDAIEEGDSKNNTRAAAQMYLRAMRQLRNALRKYLHDNPDALQDFERGNATEPEPDLNTTTSEEIEETRVRLIERFQERFRERLSLMYDNLDNMTGGLSDGDAVKARDTIRRTEGKLLGIQDRISRGEYDGAVDDLENATESMDEGFGGMEDAFAGQTLRIMNRLEARFQKLVEQHERKRARGEDTGALDGLIDELRRNISRSRDEVKVGWGDSGRGQGNGGGKPDDTGKPDKGDK